MNDHLVRFVPSAVRDMIKKNPEAPDFIKQERDVSILFLDITGYTRLSQTLPPSTLNALVERYLSVFLDEVAEREGHINETMGDGFMAVFQSTYPIPHAVRAADAALALLSATTRLNERSRQPPIEVHIGVASGLALLGSTQFEGRFNTRWVFSAIGREVNLAARLASAARGGQILISPETRCRLGGHYVIMSEGSRKLKNIEEEIEIFQLVRST